MKSVKSTSSATANESRQATRQKKASLTPPPLTDASRDSRRWPTDPYQHDSPGFLLAARSSDPLAEELGEAFLRHATSGQDDELDTLNELVPEEIGGPFIQTASHVEFAAGVDESNPEDAFREALPRT